MIKTIKHQERKRVNKLIMVMVCLLSFATMCGCSNRADQYRKEAEQGDADAQYSLGECYDFGVGVAQDKAEAVEWYRKAAEQGNVKAQSNLGVCYFRGEGVVQDKAEAVKWYRKAAEQGNVKAQFNLGVCYFRGEGVVQDDAEAMKWFRKVPFFYLLGGKTGGTVIWRIRIEDAEAEKWFREVAEQEDVLCWAWDANSSGPFLSAAAGAKWLRKAAEQGNEDAKVAFKELEECCGTVAN